MKGTKNLTQGPILRQLFTLAMPIMATSFIQMAYSLTDMAWVGRLGSEAIAAVGVNTGYVKSGSRSIDIAEEIASAKQAVSNQLVDAVQEFFESSMISIRTISNILVCGGGAEVSSNKEIKPISDYIVNYMKRLSPDIKLVKIPEDEEGNPVSSRLLNINGAGILAE